MAIVFKKIKDMTLERILEITNLKGEFIVHKYRFRDNPTRSKVYELRKQGLLKKTWETKTEIAYKLTDKPS